MKTADEIVRALATFDEPFVEDAVDDSLFCPLCLPLHGTDYRHVELLNPTKGEDPLSMIKHGAECTWRQSVEYVRAAGK